MAELKVRISADVSEGKKLVRTLKEIKKASGGTAGSLAATSKAAQGATVSLQTTVSASGQLATTQNLAAVANVAVAKTLGTVSAQATKVSLSEKIATAATDRLSVAFARMQAVGTGAFFKVGASAKRFGTQMRTAAGSVIGASTAAAGFGAVVAVGLGVGVKSAVEFEKTMSRIEGLVGASAAQVEAFKQPLLDIGKATAKGPNELAEALFFITSAGAEGQDALDILEASAKAAAAGLGETKQVADAVTSAMNAYGKENLSASRATDILVATVKEGKAEADSIAGALGQILPTAAELGIEFQELGGAIAALTRIGLGADQAATSLGATMAAIQKPGADAQAALEEFGLTASGLRKTVREEGLLVALQQMQEAFGDNETALTRVVPNIRALRAVLPLVGRNAGNVSKIFDNVAGSVGEAERAFEVYTKTSSFDFAQSQVVLQTTLLKLGNDILPAVTKAFVTFVDAIASSVDFVKQFSENVAEFFVGSDDPLKIAQKNLAEVQRSLRNLDTSRISDGAATFNAWQNDLLGVSAGNVELEGSLENQIELLRKEERVQQAAIEQWIKLEESAAARNATLEETAKITKDISDTPAAVVIDSEKLASGEKSLADLERQVAFLNQEFTELSELGQDGIGLAEDLDETRVIVGNLQGTLEGAAKKVRGLVNEKRRLSEEVAKINEEFDRQRQAVSFLDDLIRDTDLLTQKFAALKSGGTLIDIDSLQQAQQIFDDLSAEDKIGRSPQSIQQEIALQTALNEAIDAIPVDRVAELVRMQQILLDSQENAKTGEAFDTLGEAADRLGASILDARLAAIGLDGLDQIMLDAMPKEEQFEKLGMQLKDALALHDIVDPEDPRFIAAFDALKAKIFGTTDLFETFGKAAAENLQQSFSDFLFDPFEDGLSGMAASFGNMLKRLTSDILSNMILESFFKQFAGGGGGVGSFANAALGALTSGKRAGGGPVQRDQSFLVGERGPEIFTPRQSGNVASNESMRQQAAPEVNVGGPTIVNTIDDGMIVAAFNRGGGEKTILNNMTENKAAFRQALGIGN